MPNTGLIQKTWALSPHLEMIGRNLYWRNVGLIGRVVAKSRKRRRKRVAANETCDFGDILQFLKASGVGRDALMVIHSAYGPLKSTRLTPDQVLDELLAFTGPGGTLAMPAMTLFSNARPAESYLDETPDDNLYVYDVQKSPIKTGVLPSRLHRRPDAIRSRHPINSMVALGALSTDLMKDNLSGDAPLPCGVTSSWKRCVDHDAFIVSLGTDLTHSLTMIHVAEDCNADNWPVADWYQQKRFRIVDGDWSEDRTLPERRPKWGALHFAERTLCRDLLAQGVMQSRVINGVIVEVMRAKALLDFLNERNHRGYPYFWLPG